MGKASRGHTPSITSAVYTGVASDLSHTRQRFWKVEEVPKNSVSSTGDTYCTEHFASTAHQQPDGRYLVRPPFCKQPDFPKSRHIAQACLLSLKRRFARQPKLATDYRGFMQAYIDLGHVKPVPSSSIVKPDHYIPHHAVYKRNKIRVIFNVSQKAENGLSLSDCLNPGPEIQDDLLIILTRWRFRKQVFVADIVKIYRHHFSIHSEDANYQRIL